MKKKRRKSLVGYTDYFWLEKFKYIKDGYNFEPPLTIIDNSGITRKKLRSTDSKVRITIEEI